MLDIAEEARMISKVTFFYGPLHDHLPPISQTIQGRRTRHAGHCWKSNNDLMSDVPLRTSTRLLTSHLTLHSCKANKTDWALLEKKERTYKWRSSMDPNTTTHLPSHKPSKLDKQDMLNIAGEERTNLSGTFFYGTCQCYPAIKNYSSLRTRDGVEKICREWWMIWTDDKRVCQRNLSQQRDLVMIMIDLSDLGMTINSIWWWDTSFGIWGMRSNPSTIQSFI